MSAEIDGYRKVEYWQKKRKIENVGKSTNKNVGKSTNKAVYFEFFAEFFTGHPFVGAPEFDRCIAVGPRFQRKSTRLKLMN